MHEIRHETVATKKKKNKYLMIALAKPDATLFSRNPLSMHLQSTRKTLALSLRSRIY